MGVEGSEMERALARQYLVALDFPGILDGEEFICNAGDQGLTHGSGRSSGKRNGYPLQYSCLENPVDEGAWWAIIHGVTKSGTQMSD